MTAVNDWELAKRALQRLRLYAQERLSDYAGMRSPDGPRYDVALAEQALRALERRYNVMCQQWELWVQQEWQDAMLFQLVRWDHQAEEGHGGGNGAAPDQEK